jgi:ribulose-phosphate 3-epimerase
MVKIAPSLLACDFARLDEEIRDVEGAGADVLHVDVMDGHFVPNITVGPVVVRAISDCAHVPLDVHLMIDEPERYFGDFVEAGADMVTFHIELDIPHVELARRIREAGAIPGISLNPATPASALAPVVGEVDLVLVMTVNPGFGGQEFMPEVLPKIAEIKQMMPPNVTLSVDGGLNDENAAQVVEAGAAMLVAGPAVFGKRNRSPAIRRLRGDLS